MAATALIPASTWPGALVPVMERARGYASQAKARSTIRAYAADWRDFEAWSFSHGLVALPATAGTVALYLSDRADTHKPGTLQRRLSAISQAHQMVGYESPTKSAAVRTVMAGVRRAKGTAQRGKAPVLTDDVRAMIARLPDGLLGLRDRALLLVGFAGAFRRSELVGLNVEDLEFSSDGLVVLLRRSKTDQESEGRKVGIPYGSTPATCPVRSLRAWLDAAQISARSLFRPVNRHGRIQSKRLSDKAVARVVKRSAAAIGLDSAKYAGHSLRAGLATQAAANGASERSIMDQTGHRSLKMVRRYIRDGSLFRENAAARLGL